MLQSMGSQRVGHDWVTELNWCQGGLCDWYFEPILSYNHNITDKTACFISYWEKHDIISTMLWRFAFLFVSVSFYITYFKSLLAVYIFKSFTFQVFDWTLELWNVPLWAKFSPEVYFVVWWLLSHKRLGILRIFMIQVSPAFHLHTFYILMCVCSVAQQCLTLWQMDCSLTGSSVHGSFQARILEWVAISFSRGSSQPRDRTHIFCVSSIGRQIRYHFATRLAPIF